LTEFTDDEMRARISAAKPYTIALLKSGPDRNRPDADAIVWEHARRNLSLKADGALPIVCPIRDGTNVHGLYIFDRSVEEAKTLLDGDPGVQAGIFSYELHPCRGFPGSALPG